MIDPQHYTDIQSLSEIVLHRVSVTFLQQAVLYWLILYKNPLYTTCKVLARRK